MYTQNQTSFKEQALAFIGEQIKSLQSKKILSPRLLILKDDIAKTNIDNPIEEKSKILKDFQLIITSIDRDLADLNQSTNSSPEDQTHREFSTNFLKSLKKMLNAFIEPHIQKPPPDVNSAKISTSTSTLAIATNNIDPHIQKNHTDVQANFGFPADVWKQIFNWVDTQSLANLRYLANSFNKTVFPKNLFFELLQTKIYASVSHQHPVLFFSRPKIQTYPLNTAAVPIGKDGTCAVNGVNLRNCSIILV